MRIRCNDCNTILNLDETGYSPGERIEGFCPRCGAMVSGMVEKSLDKKKTPENIHSRETVPQAKPASQTDEIKKMELELKAKELALKEKELELLNRQHNYQREKDRQNRQQQPKRIYHDPGPTDFDTEVPRSESSAFRIKPDIESIKWAYWTIVIIILVLFIWIL